MPYNITEDEIRSIFGAYGEVTNIKLPKNKEGKFKGFAYISYSNQEDAIKAFAELDNKTTMVCLNSNYL